MSNSPGKLNLRPAVPADAQLIIGFIQALAAYEKLAHEVVITQADLHAHLFGERPFAEVIIAEWEGQPVGFALFFHNYSTFAGKPGIYLEDVFVNPEARGRGIGKAIMLHLASLAVSRGCARFEWSVLDWNAPSIAFYKKLGGVPLEEWSIFRLSGDALAALSSMEA